MSYVYGGYACQKVYDKIRQRHGKDNFIIFSIVSDDMLPFELSFLLEKVINSDNDDFHVYILGDLFGIDIKKWRLRNYLLFELSFLDKNIFLHWYDGDYIRDGSEYFLINPLKIDKINMSFPVYSKLDMHLNSSIEEISFHSDLFYPVNILNGMSIFDINNIFEKLCLNDKLRKIKCCFINNLQLYNIPDQVSHLDFRGCENIDLKLQRKNYKLEYINLSACGFLEIPEYLYKFNNLRVLHIYKNRISHFNQNNIPEKIESLSLYRNNISKVVLDLNRFSRLYNLNIGANPIKELIILGKNRLNRINIGVRKVKLNELTITSEENVSFYL